MAKNRQLIENGIIRNVDNGRSIIFGNTISKPNDPEKIYSQWLSRMAVVPTQQQSEKYLQLITDLSSVIDKLDALWLHAGHDETSMLQNVINSKYTLTKVGTGMTWAANYGYTSTTTTAGTDYLATGYIPSDNSDGKLCTDTSISMGCYCTTTGGTFGTIACVSPVGDMNFRGSGATRIMGNSTDVYSAQLADGHFALTYQFDNVRKRSLKIRNGMVYNSRDNDYLLDFATTCTRPNVEYYIAKVNNPTASPTAQNGVTAQRFVYSWCGKSISELEAKIICWALDRYMNSIGITTGYNRNIGVTLT